MLEMILDVGIFLTKKLEDIRQLVTWHGIEIKDQSL